MKLEYAIEMDLCGMIQISHFMKIGMGIKAILRLCLRNLRCCNVGIIDGIYDLRY